MKKQIVTLLAVISLTGTVFVGMAEAATARTVRAIATPVYVNTLDVTLGSGVISSEIKEGASNVSTLSFKLIGGRKDLNVKKIILSGYYDQNGDNIFGQMPGSETVDGKTYFLNNLISAVKLYDETGKFIGSPNVLDATGRVVFSNFNFFMPKNVVKQLIVKVDTRNNNSAQNQKFYFNIVSETDVSAISTTLPNQVKINDGDGNYKDAFVGPNKNKATIVTVKPVEIISNEHIDVKTAYSKDTTALPGQTKVKASAFQLNGIKSEDILVSKLTLKTNYSKTESGSTGLENPIGKVTISYNNLAEAYAYPDSKGYVNFSDLNYKLPKNAYGTINVYLDINGDAKTSAITIDFIGDSNSYFLAIGQASGKIYTETSVNNVYGTQKTYVYQSKPYFATVTGEGNCPTSSITYGQNAPIYCFKVTADVKGSVDLFKVSLNYSSAGLGSGSTGSGSTGSGSTGLFKLYDLSSQNEPLAEFYKGGDSQTILEFQLNNSLRIYEGQTRYFVVKGDIFANPNSTMRMIQTNIAGEIYAPSNSGGQPAWLLYPYRNIWSDVSSQNHSLSSYDWFTGYALDTIPTEKLTLTD